jgi:hypothetical protein
MLYGGTGQAFRSEGNYRRVLYFLRNQALARVPPAAWFRFCRPSRGVAQPGRAPGSGHSGNSLIRRRLALKIHSKPALVSPNS